MSVFSRLRGALGDAPWWLKLTLGLALASFVVMTTPWWLPGCRSAADDATLAIFGFVGGCAFLVIDALLARARSRGALVVAMICSVLVVLPVAFVLAGTVLSNSVGAIERGKQKRTMSDQRTIATALEAYAAEAGAYPIVTGPSTEVVPLLPSPDGKPLPVLDSWGHPFYVESTARSYTITSYGLCGEPDPPDAARDPVGGTHGYRCDMVFTDGYWLVFPDGTQIDEDCR